MTDDEVLALRAILGLRNRDATGFAPVPRGVPLRIVAQLRTGGLVETRELASGGVDVKLTINGLRELADAQGPSR